MRILFTGGSSFTGYWFVKELASAGHEVVATFRRRAHEYPDERRRTRVGLLTDLCRPVFGISFGDENFQSLIRVETWDLLCAHAADVTNYRSAEFDITSALENNTRQLPKVLDLLSDSGCRKILLTGSVFENDEGIGSTDLPAFSPYGLSKGLTWQVFRYYAHSRRMALGKFVIPNPFGPYEEPRFTHYLVKSWFADSVATVNTPHYVRDNIHVSLLAMVYRQFAEALSEGVTRIRPSGYVESQGAFTVRFADEMRHRLGLRCAFALKHQTEFAEPRVRINADVPTEALLGWSETRAWDELADYYKRLMRTA